MPEPGDQLTWAHGHSLVSELELRACCHSYLQAHISRGVAAKCQQCSTAHQGPAQGVLGLSDMWAGVLARQPVWQCIAAIVSEAVWVSCVTCNQKSVIVESVRWYWR